jgi:hypothetical protein
MMQKYLDGKQIALNPKSLQQYIDKPLLSVHKADTDHFRGQTRVRTIVIEKIEGKNLFLTNGDVTWLPDYIEIVEKGNGNE